MNNDTLDQWVQHSREVLPRESCGVLAIVKGRERYFPCKNLAIDDDQFIIDPLDFAKIESTGEVIGICHSHPFTAPTPSQADKIGCEKTNVPWYILNPNTRKWTINEPHGYVAPLIGREWVWAISDCWTLTRDWYGEKGIELRDWDRPLTFKEFESAPYFDTSWEDTGFFEVEKKDMQMGDSILMCLESKKINHCGVYVGEQMLLHHLRGRLSSRDIYGSWLQSYTMRVLRHHDWQKLYHS